MIISIELKITTIDYEQGIFYRCRFTDARLIGNEKVYNLYSNRNPLSNIGINSIYSPGLLIGHRKSIIYLWGISPDYNDNTSFFRMRNSFNNDLLAMYKLKREVINELTSFSKFVYDIFDSSYLSPISLPEESIYRF